MAAAAALLRRWWPPTSNAGGRSCPGPWPPQTACHVYLGAHFPLDVAAGAGLGMFIGGVLNLVFGVPSNSPGTAHASRLP